MSFTTKENFSEGNFYFILFVWAGSGSAFLGSWIRIRIFRQLDPDPHLEKLLDPDSQKMKANPQPCILRIISSQLRVTEHWNAEPGQWSNLHNSAVGHTLPVPGSVCKISLWTAAVHENQKLVLHRYRHDQLKTLQMSIWSEKYKFHVRKPLPVGSKPSPQGPVEQLFLWIKERCYYVPAPTWGWEGWGPAAHRSSSCPRYL